MNKLEDIRHNTSVRSIPPNCLVMSKAMQLTCADSSGKVTDGCPWSFDGVAEAHRIGLAHLFNSMRVVHTSVVEPLPYRMTSVFDAASPRSRTDDN